MKSLTINNFSELPFDVAEAVNQLRVNLSFTDANIKKSLLQVLFQMKENPS